MRRQRRAAQHRADHHEERVIDQQRGGHAGPAPGGVERDPGLAQAIDRSGEHSNEVPGMGRPRPGGWIDDSPHRNRHQRRNDENTDHPNERSQTEPRRQMRARPDEGLGSNAHFADYFTR
jgi:hypothetical protein